MIRFINAEKDATIYEDHPDENTGLDPILELGTESSRRFLIQFDLDELPISSGYETRLIVNQTESIQLPIEYTINAHPIENEWDMGIGRFGYEYDNSGITWNTFDSGSGYSPTPVSEQEFSYESSNLNIDVTNIVTEMVSNTIPKNGFLVKFSDDNTSPETTVKFYSKETNTIFQPKLRVEWDDSVYDDTDKEVLTADHIYIQPTLKTSYKVDTIQRINVKAREKYPVRQFDKVRYEYDKILPEETYYRIVDVVSRRVIIPFSDYSKVSLDDNGHFFRLDFSNWETDRVYEVQLKTNRNGDEEFFADRFLFTLIK